MSWLESPCDLENDYTVYMDQRIEEEMRAYKADAVKRLYMLTNSNLSEALAATIAYGYEEGLAEARNIVLELDLCDKHIAALNDDARYMLDILSDEILQNQDPN